MPKELNLAQTTDFINTLITTFDLVGIKRIVSPHLRLSDPRGETLTLYSASMIPDSHIQFCIVDDGGAVTLYTNSCTFQVTETNNGEDAYIYRFEAGEDLHFSLTVRNITPDQTPLTKFIGS